MRDKIVDLRDGSVGMTVGINQSAHLSSFGDLEASLEVSSRGDVLVFYDTVVDDRLAVTIPPPDAYAMRGPMRVLAGKSPDLGGSGPPGDRHP